MGASAGTQTSIPRGVAVGALQAAGAPPSGLSVISAQSAYETFGWQGGLWNWNFGNVTTTSDDYVLLPGNDLHFASYPSMEAGAAAFIAYLRSHGLIAVSSDLSAYVERLKQIGYAGQACASPGVPAGCQDYSAYQAGMANWQAKLADVVPVPPSAIAGNGAAVAALAGGGALAVAIHFGWVDRLWLRLRP